MAPRTQCPGCLRNFASLPSHWALQSALNSCRPPDVLITTKYIVEVPVATQRLAPQVPVVTLRPRSPIIKNKKRKKGHTAGSDLPTCRGDAPNLSQHNTTTSNTNQFLLNNSDLDNNDNHHDDKISLLVDNQNVDFDDMDCDSDAPVPPGSVFPQGSPDQNSLVYNQVNNPGGITANKGDDKDADNDTNNAYNGDDENGANNGTEKGTDHVFDKNGANTSTYHGNNDEAEKDNADNEEDREADKDLTTAHVDTQEDDTSSCSSVSSAEDSFHSYNGDVALKKERSYIRLHKYLHKIKAPLNAFDSLLALLKKESMETGFNIRDTHPKRKALLYSLGKRYGQGLQPV